MGLCKCTNKLTKNPFCNSSRIYCTKGRGRGGRLRRTDALNQNIFIFCHLNTLKKKKRLTV